HTPSGNCFDPRSAIILSEPICRAQQHPFPLDMRRRLGLLLRSSWALGDLVVSLAPRACAPAANRWRALCRESSMSESPSRLKVSNFKDVAVVEFRESKILDEMNISEIGQALTTLVESRDRPKLLL